MAEITLVFRRGHSKLIYSKKFVDTLMIVVAAPTFFIGDASGVSQDENISNILGKEKS